MHSSCAAVSLIGSVSLDDVGGGFTVSSVIVRSLSTL
jgi:hypothetical protein